MNISGVSLFGVVVAMVAYLLVMLSIGFLASRKNETVGDFYLGGRKLGPFVTAMSAEASDMSSWLLMGLPGLAYLSGVAEPVWTAVGLAIGAFQGFWVAWVSVPPFIATLAGMYALTGEGFFDHIRKGPVLVYPQQKVNFRNFLQKVFFLLHTHIDT